MHSDTESDTVSFSEDDPAAERDIMYVVNLCIFITIEKLHISTCLMAVGVHTHIHTVFPTFNGTSVCCFRTALLKHLPRVNGKHKRP